MTPSSRPEPRPDRTEEPGGWKCRRPAIIIVGGFAGSGKTVVSRRLSAELRIPRLGSDTLGRAIKTSAGVKNGDAYWIAYDVLLCLCEEFIRSGVSLILDLTMGWEFQWQQIDDIIRRCPGTLLVPIILRCPLGRCIERTRERHQADPEYYDPPEIYNTDPKNVNIWKFLAQLDRPDFHLVDGDRPRDEVYAEVLEFLSTRVHL